MWASMALREAPRRPTSVTGFSTSTRRERSPAAMAAAVFSTRESGRKERATVQVAMKNASTRVKSPTPTTTRRGVFHDFVHGVQGQPDDDNSVLPGPVVHDVDRHHTPVAAGRAVDLEGRVIPRFLASTGLMVAMLGRSVWLPPNGYGGWPWDVERQGIVGGHGRARLRQLGEGLLLLGELDGSLELVIHLPLEVALDKRQRPGAGGGQGKEQQPHDDGDQLRPEGGRFPTVKQGQRFSAVRST